MPNEPQPVNPPAAPQPGDPGAAATGGTPPLAVPAAVVVPPPPAEPGTKDVPDWEKKFKGLQPVYQQLQERHNALEAEKSTLATQLASLQSTVDLTKKELDDTKGKFTSQGDSLTGIMEELTNYKLLERKLNVLRTRAPHLLQFEPYVTVSVPDELLEAFPNLNEEQNKALDDLIGNAIDTFATTVAGYVAQQVQAQHAGVVPPTSPARPGEPDMGMISQKLMETAGTGEYNKWLDLWIKLLEKQGQVDSEGLWRPPD